MSRPLIRILLGWSCGSPTRPRVPRRRPLSFTSAQIASVSRARPRSGHAHAQRPGWRRRVREHDDGQQPPERRNAVPLGGARRRRRSPSADRQAVAHAGSTLPCRKPSEDPVGRAVDGRRPAPAGLHDTGGRADGAGTASTRRPCAPVPGGRPGCLHVVPSSGLTRKGQAGHQCYDGPMPSAPAISNRQRVAKSRRATRGLASRRGRSSGRAGDRMASAL